MEFAATALTSIASAIGSGAGAGVTEAVGATVSAGTAAAGTAASGAGGLLGALGQTSTWGSILQGGATAASVLAATRAGEDKAFGLEQAALDAELETKIEGVQGLARRSSIRKALVAAIGERDVATAASGVDLSFGTPKVARREAVVDSERALAIDASTEELRKSRLISRATLYRYLADEAREGGLYKAIGLGLSGLGGLLRRG